MCTEAQNLGWQGWIKSARMSAQAHNAESLNMTHAQWLFLKLVYSTAAAPTLQPVSSRGTINSSLPLMTTVLQATAHSTAQHTGTKDTA